MARFASGREEGMFETADVNLSRRALSAELLGRPPLHIGDPSEYVHVVRMIDEGGHEVEFARLRALCERFGQPAPHAADKRCTFEIDRLRFQWERHSEFVSYTLGTCADEVRSILDLLPAEVVEEWRNRQISAAHIRLHAAPDTDEERTKVIRRFLGTGVCGGSVCDSNATVWTDFEIRESGFTPYIILDGGLTPGRRSRLVRRITELDTYRMLAMLGFPIAQSNVEYLARMERDLESTVSKLRHANDENGVEECLTELLTLAKEVASLRVESGSRFGATRAYHAIVGQRLRNLNEQRIQGYQRCTAFLTDRLSPAMKTCEIVAERLEILTQNLERVTALVRTRIDLSIQNQNKEQLQTGNALIQQQLRLQRSVETFSIVAISYCAIGILSWLTRGVESFGLPLNHDRTLMVLTPIVVLGIFATMKRLLHKAEQRGGS